MTPIEAKNLPVSEVACSNCQACCCRLEVVILTDTGVPERYIEVDEWGGETMHRLEDGWCSALDRDTFDEVARIETPGRPRHVISSQGVQYVHGQQGFVLHRIENKQRTHDVTTTSASASSRRSRACNENLSDGASPANKTDRKNFPA